jgi:hypothetical protein
VAYPIVTSPRGWQSIVVSMLVAASLAPRMVAGAEIPFFLHMANATDCVCIECDGPWLRSGAGGPYAAHTPDPINFYSAEINIFSPFGEWTCGLVAPNGGCQGDCPGEILLAPRSSAIIPQDFPEQVLHICVPDFPGIDSVDIRVTGTTATSDLPGPPCSSAVTARAFLGDSPEASRDRDAFRFAGEAGATVNVTLEPDRRSGHHGALARMAVLGEGDGHVLGKVSGAVPLALTAQLPRAGTYRIVVQESKDSKAGHAFRGTYVVGVNPSSSAPTMLEPLRSVEPLP